MNNNERINIDRDGFSISIDLHPRFAYGRLTKARVYVSGEEAVDFTEAYAATQANDPDNQGIDEATNKLWKRLNRQVVKNQKEVIEEAQQTLAALDTILAAGGKLTFSRTAGCSCGCSPAFVPQVALNTSGRAIQSIFIRKLKEA